jgi:hypothetical protein
MRNNIIVSILAVIGISMLFKDYPLLVGLSSFGIGIAYFKIKED